jgi:hypothetical protein
LAQQVSDGSLGLEERPARAARRAPRCPDVRGADLAEHILADDPTEASAQGGEFGLKPTAAGRAEAAECPKRASDLGHEWVRPFWWAHRARFG